MAKGVFSGVIWGAVVAVAGAGGLSLAYPDFKPDALLASKVATTTDADVAEDNTQASVAEESSQPMSQTMPQSDDAVVPMVETPAVEVSDEDASAEEMASEITEDMDVPEIAEPESDAMNEDIVEPETMGVEMVQDETGEVDVPETMTPTPEVEVSEEVAEVFVPDEGEPAPLIESETQDAADETIADETDEAVTAEADTTDVATNVTDEIIAALPKPEGTVGDLAPTVTTGRLPSLASDDETEADTPSALAPSPFELFAAASIVDSDKPRMAIVLIDDGDSELGLEALEAFPYPLTFAVDATTADAAQRMKIYRDKGFEVLALVDLPRGATPSDVEVAMSAYLAAVPEAVGILEGVETGVQTSREMADQLTQIILASGHGMLLQKSGLNTARKLAEREGIPAGTVFRDFDGNGQSASVMRRFLDQAAFCAGQEGGVVMMGRLQAETISALLIWGLADRASRVALVPVSAVLQQDAADEG